MNLSTYWKEEFALLDHYIKLYHIAFEQYCEMMPPHPSGFFGITPDEAKKFANPNLQISNFRKKFLESSEGLVWQKKLWQLQKNLLKQPENSTSLTILAKRFSLSELEKLILFAVLAPQIETRYQKIYGYLQDNVNCKQPTIGWLEELFCLEDIFLPATFLKENIPLSCQSNLFRWELIAVLPNPILFHTQLYIPRRVLDFLLYHNDYDFELLPFCQYFPLEKSQLNFTFSLVMQEQIECANRAIQFSQSKPMLIIISGSCSFTRSYFSQQIANSFKACLLRFNILQILESMDKRNIFIRIIREAYLLSSGILLDEIELPIFRQNFEILFRLVENFPYPIFLSSSKPLDLNIWKQKYSFHEVVLSNTNYEERQIIWKKYLPDISEEDLHLLANRYRFTPAQIYQTILSYQHDLKNSSPSQTIGFLIEKFCKEQCYQNISSFALRVQGTWKWEDLVVSIEVKNRLQEICSRFQYHTLVYESWNFRNNSISPFNFIVLFTGTSGTGKTMSASIIANELGLELYKIDLSQIISKYVGETEKNLEKIFSEAEHGNILLFFDEADSIFGKRSQIQSSHDRYANTEVSYLLQRIEIYDGMIILATNFPENMDDAFLRRIHDKIEFPFPDVQSRKLIWQKSFGKRSPQSDTIDFELLATRFQLSGGHIHNIVLSSAFLAASQQQSIGMDHLLYAARKEYEKIGKQFPEF